MSELEAGSIQVDRIWKRFRTDVRSKLRDRAQALTRRDPERERWRWALRDIDFRVAPGEAVGLVGANGSGKSTLLKILTRVMYPHSGSVAIRGRVGALIEVRAGIHPELSGRENTYLYGSLLGLPRREVARRFDDIVAFAQLEKAIDRQTKFYSTGMQMRLGFAVAAFLEPDILLVDEVLAVGDASFQQRCLERMRHVLAQGTTLVLVSHDLASVEAMCGRGLWLADGVVHADGPIREVLATYRHSIEETEETGRRAEGPVQVTRVTAERDDGFLPSSGAAATVTVDLHSAAPQRGRLYLGVSEGPAAPTFVVSHFVELEPGAARLQCRLESLPLPRGRFALWVCMLDPRDRDLVPWHPAGWFDVMGPELDPAPRAVVRLSPVLVSATWHTGSLLVPSAVNGTRRAVAAASAPAGPASPAAASPLRARQSADDPFDPLTEPLERLARRTEIAVSPPVPPQG